MCYMIRKFKKAFHLSLFFQVNLSSFDLSIISDKNKMNSNQNLSVFFEEVILQLENQRDHFQSFLRFSPPYEDGKFITFSIFDFNFEHGVGSGVPGKMSRNFRNV